MSGNSPLEAEVSLPPDTRFRSSGTKLLPSAIVLTAFAIPMSLASAVLLGTHLYDGARLTLGGVMGEALLHVASGFLLWSVVQTVRRILTPDEVRFNPDGLGVTKLGHTAWHPWKEIGRPEVVRRSTDSAARAIRIPILKAKRAHLTIAAEQYAHSIDDILMSIESARAGIFSPTPPKVSLTTYRYFAIPMTLITIGIVPAIGIYVSRL